SVGISSETIVVGAPGRSDLSGTVTVFRFDGTTWNKVEELTTANNDFDAFGAAVGISGGTMVAGARFHNIVGAAYVFVSNGGIFQQTQELDASDAAAGDLFGISVAIDVDPLVVGAQGHDNSAGAAYVFQRSGGSFAEQAKLTASDGAPNDVFGHAVGLSGESVVVGAQQSTTSAGAEAGAAYVY